MATTTETLIQKTPNVMGGSACIRCSRIAVYNLVEWKSLGKTDADLLRFYPTLNQEDLDAAWCYYFGHQEEIDTAIRENNEA